MGKDVAWMIYHDAILQRFGNVQNMKNFKQTGTGMEYYDAFKSLFGIVSFLSDMGSAETHFVDLFIDGLSPGIGNVVRRGNSKSLWSAFFVAKWEESSEIADNDIANEVLDEVSKVGDEGKIFEVSDAYVKESIEVENIVVEDVVVENVKESVEVGNEVDGFVTDRNISKLSPHKNNESLVHKKKGFHLFRRFVDKRYVEGWKDKDKDLNVFDYDYEVYNLSIKTLHGEKELFVKKKQEDDVDKFERVKLSDIDAMNNKGTIGHLKFDIWKWPKRKKIDEMNCKFTYGKGKFDLYDPTSDLFQLIRNEFIGVKKQGLGLGDSMMAIAKESTEMEVCVTRNEFIGVKKQGLGLGDSMMAIAKESTEMEVCVTRLVLGVASAYKYVVKYEIERASAKCKRNRLLKWSSLWKREIRGEEDEMYRLEKRIRKRFEGLFTYEYHPDIYQIVATQIPQALASALTFGIGMFGGKREFGAGKHRVSSISVEVVLVI
nr:hypothetical protein [Tanacetum cinerariifolium]